MEPTASLHTYVPSGLCLDRETADRWARLFDEARLAIAATTEEQMREWVLDSLADTASLVAKRMVSFLEAAKRLAGVVWTEVKAFRAAVDRGETEQALAALARRVKAAAARLWTWLASLPERACAYFASFSRLKGEELVSEATAFTGAVLGFLLVGGRGDGGAVDSDIVLMGLGEHRSIFTHSILVGFAFEAAMRSFARLVRLVHGNLPAKHDPFWDRAIVVLGRFETAFASGAWLGVATHLTVDSHLGGWTPYKDLPIALPNAAHHVVMDLNAAACGWWSWQLHDKVWRPLRDTFGSSKNGLAEPVEAKP